MPGPSCSSASTVASAASSRWIHEATPPPSPMIGYCRFRTGSISPSLAAPYLARLRGRGGIERVVLGLDGPALARVPVAGEALRDEPVDARLARGREQRVGAFRPQPVRLRERAVEIAREIQLRQGRGLVDDRVRLGLEHCLAHGARVEQV